MVIHTKRRNHSGGEPVGLWFRDIEELDSWKGHRFNNIDFMYQNECIEEHPFLLMETKCRKAIAKPWQMRSILTIHNRLAGSDGYKGFYIVTFENTTPDDGRMWVGNIEITRDEFIQMLLSFAWPDGEPLDGTIPVVFPSYKDFSVTPDITP